MRAKSGTHLPGFASARAGARRLVNPGYDLTRRKEHVRAVSKMPKRQPGQPATPNGRLPVLASAIPLLFSAVFQISRNRGKSRGGMIIRFPEGRESDSLWECRLPILITFRTPS